MWTSVKRVGTRGTRPPAGAVENMRRLGLIRPGDCVPSPSHRGPPAAGRQRVFVEDQLAVSSHVSLDIVGGRLAIAGVQGTGACSRLSPPVPDPRGGRGHTCRTPPRACSVSNATSQSVKCLGGTYASYPEQQRLRCVRCWAVLVHWGPPCSDDPASTVMLPGPWSLAARSRNEGTVRDATGITPTCVHKEGRRARRKEGGLL